jgi:hypothetical protein
MKIIYMLPLLLPVTLCSAQDLTNSSGQVKKTSFNDAAKALSNKAIADFFPMHDKQVNEILRICNKGQDIQGSVTALISLGVYLGSDLEVEEEEVIIKGSKVDVLLFNEICKNIILSFSKPLSSSIEEAQNIIKAIEEGKGKDILNGIKILAKVKYRMRRGPELIINKEQLELWSNIGKINEKDFEDTYKGLLLIGLDPELNYVSATAIMNLLSKNKVQSIVETATLLSSTGWRCEGELNQRETVIIENIINNKFEEEGSKNSLSQATEQK